MYANSYGPGSPNPLEFSNNPFVNDPTNAHARFPDISGSTLSPQSPPQYQTGYTNGYGDQSQYQVQQQYQQYTAQPYQNMYQAQPQMHNQSQFASTSYTPSYPGSPQPGVMSQPTGYGFQPTSSFGQQLQSQPQQQQYGMQAAGYQNQQYPAHQGYSQQPGNQGYLSEFDPYAQQSQPQTPANVNLSQPAGGVAPNGATHPRDFIRLHKTELEAWDSYAWKQMFNACDTLKGAWSARKQQAEGVVQQLGGNSAPGLFGPDPSFGYNGQLEGWKQVLKDANNHFDTVAASTFQLHEVFNSYRQSGDAASKRRVRESCNAALKGLPDWPSN
ncbi:hypothetical protein HYDPIDRAFT_113926 [Hydnomerulius pinastri MD-312]|uniref:Unplaced genomic scaffold scaffold_19, whole genome shotgun sequence n=1 Tax=Hydnomerulius pinastri MD-312 TaxID=994086 RepID=A0A0C9VAY3_9AGAM|nr:hypothetical protein HYDPIDRAFT_113926 [Hydnomerulius pinastri MD-312]